jgi:S1-C subfamily serine protease
LTFDAAETSPLIEQGERYETGNGVGKDLDRAEALYLAALKKGDLRGGLALSLLALSYTQSAHIAKNTAKAKLLFELYSPIFTSPQFANHPTACLAMGLTYAFGVGTRVDYRKAAQLLIQYVDSPHKDNRELDFRSVVASDLAYVGLGLQDGKTDDAKIEFRLFTRAASLGNTEVLYFLAGMYYQGRGVERDLVQAAKFMMQGAEHGDAVAQNALAIMYENGQGVPRDYVEALKWHDIAATTGEEAFVSMRDSLESRLSPSQVARAQQLATAFVQRSREAATASVPKQPAGPRKKATFSGSGFFVSQNGFFLTNYHVIEKADRILVKTSDGDFPAKIAKIDPANDVAVIKVDGIFGCLPLGATRDVALGDPVITIGYPNIDIQGVAPKLTAGEISSLSGMGDDPRVFQISVPIQPGNSGGPLVDQRGNVIGITTAQLSSLGMLKSRGSIPQNVNYAIKISYAQLLLDGIPGLSEKLLKPESSVSERSAVVERTKRATAIVLVWKGSD